MSTSVAATANDNTPVLRQIANRIADKRWQFLFMGTIVLIVRLVFLPFVQRVDWDGFFYLWYAKGILAGNWFLPLAEWTPYSLGYPTGIAAAFLLTHDLEKAGIAVSLIAGVLLILPIASMVENIGGRHAAWLVAILIALNPLLVRYSLSILTESLFTFLFALQVWFWVRHFQKNEMLRHRLLSAASSLAIVFVRPIGIAVLAGGLLVNSLRHSERRNALIHAGLVVVLSAAVYTLYAQAVSLNLQSLTGAPQPSYALLEMSRGLTQFYTDAANLGERIVEYQPPMSAVAFVQSNWKSLLKRYVYIFLERLSTGVHWQENTNGLSVFPIYLLPFFGIGLWQCAFDIKRLIPLTAAVPYLLIIPFFTSDPRYYVPLIPFFLVYVAIGLIGMINLRKSTGLVLTAGALLINTAMVYQSNYHEWPVPVSAYKEVGSWLRQNTQPDVVLSSTPAPAFYADAKLGWLENKPLGAQLDSVGDWRNRHIALVIEDNPASTSVLFNGEQEDSAAFRARLIYSSSSNVPLHLLVYGISPR